MHRKAQDVVCDLIMTTARLLTVAVLALLGALCRMDQTTTGPASTSEDIMMMAREYLARFGYDNLDTEAGRGGSGKADLRDPATSHDALINFQTRAGLTPTGQLDADTLRMMRTPRCGVPDVGPGAIGQPGDNGRRKRRFVIQGRRWSQTALTYRMSDFQQSRFLSNRDQQSIIQEAFRVWEAVSPLSFTVRRRGPVDIDVRFASGSHGDGSSFDGPGNILAHAFFPGRGLGGDIHFDADETFTQTTSQGFNLFQVAVHEMGHSLGLAHSGVRGAVMAPFYPGYQPNFRLQPDDIAGIRRIYGRQTGPTQRPSPSPRPPPTQQPPGRRVFCEDPVRFDAIAAYQTIWILAFRGEQYVQLAENGGIADGFPRLIQDTFQGLTRVRAAFTTLVPRETRQPCLVLFDGNTFRTYRLPSMEPRCTFTLTSRPFVGLLSITRNVDSVYRWSGNNRVYATRGSQYYQLTTDLARVSARYPRPLSRWRLPINNNPVDAAFQFRRRTYFFAGNSFYRFNDRLFRPDGVGNIGRLLRCDPANMLSANDDTESAFAVNGGSDAFEDVPTITDQEDGSGGVSMTSATSASWLVVWSAVLLKTLSL